MTLQITEEKKRIAKKESATWNDAHTLILNKWELHIYMTNLPPLKSLR
jgi:hypothetical protein